MTNDEIEKAVKTIVAAIVADEPSMTEPEITTLNAVAALATNFLQNINSIAYVTTEKLLTR